VVAICAPLVYGTARETAAEPWPKQLLHFIPAMLRGAWLRHRGPSHSRLRGRCLARARARCVSHRVDPHHHSLSCRAHNGIRRRAPGPAARLDDPLTLRRDCVCCRQAAVRRSPPRPLGVFRRIPRPGGGHVDRGSTPCSPALRGIAPPWSAYLAVFGNLVCGTFSDLWSILYRHTPPEAFTPSSAAHPLR
jgi:hypothetical protein